MTASISPRDPDERLLEEALVVIRDARGRAPRDYLVAIAILLGLLAAALLAIGALLGGRLGELSLNLGVEVVGALLTVVVIDGLWSRAQTASTDRLRSIEDRLQRRAWARRDGTPLMPAERAGWLDVVTEYRRLTTRTSLLDRLSAARDYGRRAQRIEHQAEQLLDDGLDTGDAPSRIE